jgi:hypothetical protein
MISSADTFEYFTVVPGGQDRSAPWRLQRAAHMDRGGLTAMLFGREPTLVISDADPPTNASPKRPFVLRSRFTLSGNDRTACFHVDRSLTSALGAGDVIHIARTERGGLGLSVLRNQRLVVAVGAVTAVPLGESVRARIAPELQDQAIALVEPPPGIMSWNAREQYGHEWPVEIQIDGTTHLFFVRNENIHGIQFFMVHGFRLRAPSTLAQGLSTPKSVQGVVGTDECVALSRVGQSPVVGANASALLLAADGLELSKG